MLLELWKEMKIFFSFKREIISFLFYQNNRIHRRYLSDGHRLLPLFFDPIPDEKVTTVDLRFDCSNVDLKRHLHWWFPLDNHSKEDYRNQHCYGCYSMMELVNRSMMMRRSLVHSKHFLRRYRDCFHRNDFSSMNYYNHLSLNDWMSTEVANDRWLKIYFRENLFYPNYSNIMKTNANLSLSMIMECDH